jgi:hypothetical protein
LVDPAAALLPVRPEARLKHPGPKGLAGNGEAVLFAELLGGQRRTEVGVALLDDGHSCQAHVIGRPAVTGLAALLRDQAIGAAEAVGLQQSPDLSLSEPEDLGGGAHRHPLVVHVPQDLKLRQLHIAHDPHRH